RFWLNNRLSLAPTLMGMYGHTSNEFTATSAFIQANLGRVTRMGLVGWNENTWTVRPAVNIQYLLTWHRTIFTLSSDPTFFHTESFSSSDSRDIVDGDSGSLADKIDVDVPLGKRVYGRRRRFIPFLNTKGPEAARRFARRCRSFDLFLAGAYAALATARNPSTSDARMS